MQVRFKHLAIPVSIIAGVGATLITSAVAQSGGQRSAQATGSDTLVSFKTFLNGPDEFRTTPPNPTGDPLAFGEATVTIDKVTNQICVNFTDTALGPFNGFHIHIGDDTVRSGNNIVVDFAPGAGAVTPFYKCVTDTDATAIAANPSGFYLNAHTTAIPSGAISGQLNNEFTTGTKETNLLAAPFRAYDTRFGGLTKFAPNTTRSIDLSASGIPLSARAAIVTVTVTRADAAGFLTVYSDALATAPNTSNVNFGAAVDAANNITVATAAGKIKITSGATGNEDVVVDVVGYVS
jgi:hypothetical protein